MTDLPPRLPPHARFLSAARRRALADLLRHGRLFRTPSGFRRRGGHLHRTGTLGALERHGLVRFDPAAGAWGAALPARSLANPEEPDHV
jgi:hypothetical protein